MIKIGDRVKTTSYGYKGRICKISSSCLDHFNGDEERMNDWLNLQEKPFSYTQVNHEKWYTVLTEDGGSVNSCESTTKKLDSINIGNIESN